MTITRSSLLAFVAIALAAPLATAQTVDRTGVTTMVGAINAERARQNLTPLTEDPRLNAVAEAHSLDMARARFFSHTSPTTGQPAERVTSAGMSWNAVAENIAINQSPQAAQQSLVRSPGHYQNMVDPAQRSVGVGIVRHGEQVWVTQLFAALNGPAPVAAPVVTPPPSATAPTAPTTDDDSTDEDDADQGSTDCDAETEAPAPAAPVAAAPLAPTVAAPVAPSVMPWQSIPGLDQFLTGLGMSRQPSPPAVSVPAAPTARAARHQVYVVQTPFGPVRVEVPGAMATPAAAPAARPAAPRSHRRRANPGRVVQLDTLDV